MAPQRPSHSSFAQSTTCILLLAVAPCPVVSFLSLPEPVCGRRRSLAAAYINPDVGSYPGGRDSYHNTTLNSEKSQSSPFNNMQLDEEEFDTVGAGTLGDIMAGTQNNADTNPSQSAITDGLVTKEGGELNAKFGCKFSPMERITLTANGNLQRIFSSYYDSPIHVHVDSCTRRDGKQSSVNVISNELDKFSYRIESNGAVWDRVVHLHVYEQTLCKATSVIQVRSPECIELIEEGTVGLGQLFRYLNKLPTFKLLNAGRTNLSENMNGDFNHSIFHGGIWRTYELKCEEMTCLIHEEFHRDAWDINPSDSTDIQYKPML